MNHSWKLLKYFFYFFFFFPPVSRHCFEKIVRYITNLQVLKSIEGRYLVGYRACFSHTDVPRRLSRPHSRSCRPTAAVTRSECCREERICTQLRLLGYGDEVKNSLASGCDTQVFSLASHPLSPGRPNQAESSRHRHFLSLVVERQLSSKSQTLQNTFTQRGFIIALYIYHLQSISLISFESAGAIQFWDSVIVLFFLN